MRSWRRFAAVASSCALLAIAGDAAGQTNITWNGPFGGQWSVAGNWLPNQVPNNAGSPVVAIARFPVVDTGLVAVSLVPPHEVAATSAATMVNRALRDLLTLPGLFESSQKYTSSFVAIIPGSSGCSASPHPAAART